MPQFNNLPWLFAKNIKDINYDYLISLGIKGLFFDLDNTILPPNVEVIPQDTFTFLKNLEKRFKVVIITNNSTKRTMLATNHKFDCITRAMKPFPKGLKQALSLTGLSRSEVVIIGDQLNTDVKLAVNNGLKSILVNPIDLKKEKITTKINRFFENIFLNRLLKTNHELYNHYFKDFKK